MSLRNRRRKRRAAIPVPLASLGDIAFLLIIFFVLVSNFKDQSVDLEQPAAPNIERLESAGLVVSVDRDGQVWFDGSRYQADALESILSARVADREDKTVLFRADKDLSHREIGPVIDAMSKAGVTVAMTGQRGES